MARTKVPFARVAMLSLALSISTSCAQLAAPLQLDSQKAGKQHHKSLPKSPRFVRTSSEPWPL